MRFKVDNKSHGKAMKKVILDIANDNDFVSLYDAKSIVLDYSVQDLEDKKIGWRYTDLKGKIRVRKISTGWYLYLPEPELKINLKCECAKDPFEEDEPFDPIAEAENENKEFVDYLISQISEVMVDIRDSRRKCRIVRKVKGHKHFENAMFHCWFTHSVPVDGEIITQLLAVVEFEDGHVEQVQPRSIIFGEREDK